MTDKILSDLGKCFVISTFNAVSSQIATSFSETHS